MKVRHLLQRIIGGKASRDGITSELVDVYYLASELSVKAQMAERTLDRLEGERRG